MLRSPRRTAPSPRASAPCPSRRATLATLLAAAAAAPLLASCASDGAGTSADEQAPAPGADVSPDDLTLDALAALEGRELVDLLDALPVDERPDDVLASIQPHEVALMDAGGAEASVALPGDEFYVSIAPFATGTHDCFFHSLTTCLGELRGEELQVRVVDEASGEALVDETLETFDNGFFGLWLPRDAAFDLTITGEAGSVAAPLGTGDDDATCVTTLQLT